jgi:integrase
MTCAGTRTDARRLDGSNCVARSDWKGHVTMPKGGRIRYVPLTKRLADALRVTRHLRGKRVLCNLNCANPQTKRLEEAEVVEN